MALPETVAIDVVAWVVIQITAGYVVHRLPDRALDSDRWLFRQRNWERDGQLYVHAFAIKRWKRQLPEGGDLFPGGFNKARLRAFDEAHLAVHLRETRRAELGHVLAMVPAPVFFWWNPWWLGVIMQAYALVINLPCVVAQRYNRIRLVRVLNRRGQVHGGHHPPRSLR